MKKKNNTNKIVVLLIVGIIFLVTLLIFILNYSKDDSSFSILEKKWLNDNKNNVIDVSVYNDIPIYGLNGQGIIFDILDNFTTNYEIKFNKVSYLSNSKSNLKDIAFNIIDGNNKLTKNDILLYKDEYVLVSKDNKVINKVEDIDSKIIGVFSNDISNVSYYLANAKNTGYQPYESIDTLISALNNEAVNYIAIPQNMYLDDILMNNYNIIYHLSEMTKKYILTVKDNNLLNIVKKFYLQYKEKTLDEDYKKEYLNTIFNYKSISEEEKENYNIKVYNYGYVINMPYENTVDKEFVGTLSNYLSNFSDLTDIDFKMIKYSSVKELKNALSDGDIDMAFANFSLSGLKTDTIKTVSPLLEEYVVLSNKNIVTNSIRSLKKYKINVVEGTYLYKYLKDNKIDTITYKDTDELLRNVSLESVLIIDKDTYNYYKTKKFSDYYVIYDGVLNNEYSFVIRDVKENKTFSELYKYYVSSVNYKEIETKYNTNYMIGTKAYNELLKKIFSVLFVIFIVILIITIILKEKRKKEKLTKEDKFKFIDVMTSLKNRNYLNYNIKKWDDNVIYPQAIVIIDLNNIKYINDSYGHEEGDNVIKKAASILIVNQKENTDIVRTDGNEFLIYMVGYNEQEVVNYMRKLSKELKELKYNFGAALGYSMITKDEETIDDAINDATLAMREAKEKQ